MQCVRLSGPVVPLSASRAEMGDCGAHVTLSRGEQCIDASASGASNARWSRILDDDDSTARRWEYNSKAMVAQQEVMAMQETELPAVMTAPGHRLT